MVSRSWVLALSLSLFGVACERSGGGGSDAATAAAIESLRHELAFAGIQPQPDPPLVSDELFELGRALFFDKILSGNQDISCATCHLPQFGTSDGRTLPDGVHGLGLGPTRGGGVMIPRNSPSLFDLHLRDELFWDGRLRRTEDAIRLPPAVSVPDDMLEVLSPGLELLAIQAMLPPVARDEMRGMLGENPLANLGEGYNSPGGSEHGTGAVWHLLSERLVATPGYLTLLRAAYPPSDPPGPPLPPTFQVFGFAHAANAIAAFEARAFTFHDSPFERFVRGDDRALTSTQVRGAHAFFQSGCAACHSGSLFTDQGFHSIGLPQLGPGVTREGLAVVAGTDIGRENATGRPEDRYLFRTPSLLNVELTGPYGHAGQFERLRDMVDYYRDAFLNSLTYDVQSNVMDPALVTMVAPNSNEVLATLDPRLHGFHDLDVDAIVEFLEALTSPSARRLAELVPDSVPSGLPVF